MILLCYNNAEADFITLILTIFRKYSHVKAMLNFRSDVIILSAQITKMT